MEDRLHIRDDADVPTAVIASYERTRRDLVRRGLVTGGTVLAASSVPALLAARDAFADTPGDDAAILKAAIGLEEVAVFTYSAALRSGLLNASASAVAKLFRTHEEAHRDGLIQALSTFGEGQAPPPAPRGPRDNPLLAPLLGARSQRDVLLFAIDLESTAVAAYYDAQRKLTTASLLKTAAQIMGDEGQHLVVLRTAVGARRHPRPRRVRQQLQERLDDEPRRRRARFGACRRQRARRHRVLQVQARRDHGQGGREGHVDKP